MNSIKQRFLCNEVSRVYDSDIACNALKLVIVFEILPGSCAMVKQATNADV